MPLKKILRAPPRAVTTIQLFAAGVDGTESLSLIVDDQVVQTIANIGGNAYTEQYEQFEVELPYPVSIDQIRIAFTNDSVDRDLRIDKVVLNGETYEAEADNVFSSGTWTGQSIEPGYHCTEWLHTNGEFVFSSQPRPVGPIPGAFGNIQIDSDWSVLHHPVVMSHPIALMGPASYNDSGTGAPMIRYVDSVGFDARFGEWENEDGIHGSESIDWLMLPTGRFTTNDGSVWEIGEFDLSGVGNWTNVPFEKSFTKLPWVFLTIQTNADDVPLIVRVDNVRINSFDAALFVEEALASVSTPVERVAYVAVQPAAASGVVRIGNSTIPYLFEWSWPDDLWGGVGTGYQLGAIEETSLDAETRHYKERTNVLRLGGLLFAQDYVFRSEDPFVIRAQRDNYDVVVPEGFQVRSLVPGQQFEDAVAIDVSNDGRVFVAEERGLVWVIENGVKQPEPMIDIRSELFRGLSDEGALTGMVLDPGFPEVGFIYLLYTVEENGFRFGRVSRFREHPNRRNYSAPASQRILMGNNPTDGLIQEVFHNVGDLEFGTDGSLLVSWGDTAGNSADDDRQFRSQNNNTPAGKVFRLNRFTGQGYPTNPFYNGNGDAVQSKVWVKGLRNGFRFGVHPDNGRPFPGSGRPGTLYIVDVGRYQFEELNIARGGENFGWPYFEGNSSYRSGASINHTGPVATFPHPQARCLIGGDFAMASTWPAVYQNRFFAVDFTEGWMSAFAPDGDHTSVNEIPFGEGFRGVTDMRFDPLTGRMYFVGRGSSEFFPDGTGLDGVFYLEYVGE
ncbi:MAG: PQQ-dependent sugar dehydrogenase [Pirellulaceae bacterium]